MKFWTITLKFSIYFFTRFLSFALNFDDDQDRDVYGFNVQALGIIQVHLLPMTVKNVVLKVKIWTKTLDFQCI